ncbi:hypothetical protein ABZ721_30785 [Streptomyces sp. NPDC006733]|uniref:hypothetical protein n=1 Tax=Streptomyces sp. NPDC006733 TaxID=3155460 RepID=UPI0033C2CF76
MALPQYRAPSARSAVSGARPGAATGPGPGTCAELLSAVDAYERQMFAYGAEAVRSSLEKLPAFAPAAKLS